MQCFVDTCVDFEVPFCPEIATQDCPILTSVSLDFISPKEPIHKVNGQLLCGSTQHIRTLLSGVCA